MSTKQSKSALSTFLRRAVPFESFRAPLDPQIRKTVIVSLAVTFVGSIVFLAFAEAPTEVADDTSIRWLYVPLRGFINFLHEIRPVAFWANLGGMVLALALVVATRGLQEGNQVRNWLCLGPTCVAAADGVAVTVVLALVVLILVVWALIVALVIALSLAVIAILFAALAAWANS